jgi:hypothetical protein
MNKEDFPDFDTPAGETVVAAAFHGSIGAVILSRSHPVTPFIVRGYDASNSKLSENFVGCTNLSPQGTQSIINQALAAGMRS